MKIRFLHRNLKVLVTRISGDFNIYSKTNNKWDMKLTRGSFKVSDKLIYDKILEKIVEMQDVYKYSMSNSVHTIKEKGEWKIYKETRLDISGTRVLPNCYSYMIFDIDRGEVIDVDVDIPKLCPPKHGRNGPNIIIVFEGYGNKISTFENLPEEVKELIELKNEEPKR